MNELADHALDLILRDDRVHEHLDAESRKALGRDKRDDDDGDWWDARTKALDALLAAMLAHNTTERN